MSQKQPATINLRRLAKPKLLERRRKQLNDLEMSAIPNPTVQNDLSPMMSNPTMKIHRKNPSPQSTVENFKDIYSDLSNPASFSGDIQEIANQIPSYRYDSISEYKTTKFTAPFI